jgi:NADPH-dependent 2,4-dienoyl-CoA reductase/sulfur reductase-like enzyme
VAAARGHSVTLAEAAGELGGQFRLAGLQPRRGQILDFLAWYQGQLDTLGVEVRYHTPMEADDVRAVGADVVVLATGSQPAGTGYQRVLPGVDKLPGVEARSVSSVEDVMSRAARPGKRVLLLDDTGTWRGVGTAWYLAERGHEVCLVTPDPYVGRELTRTSADIPLREKLSRLGVEFVTDSVVRAWSEEGAELHNLMTDERSMRRADTLVLACVNEPQSGLEQELGGGAFPVHAIGDCVAPRQAPAAIYEGRKLALAL